MGADTEGQGRPPKIHISVMVLNRYAFDTEVATGRTIKEAANIPAGSPSAPPSAEGEEPIHDDEPVELHNGDHFFSRPPSNAS